MKQNIRYQSNRSPTQTIPSQQVYVEKCSTWNIYAPVSALYEMNLVSGLDLRALICWSTETSGAGKHFSRSTSAGTFSPSPAGCFVPPLGYTVTSPRSILTNSRRTGRDVIPNRSTVALNRMEPYPFRTTRKFGTEVVDLTVFISGMV